MPDEMFFSDDSLSLKRGRRRARRTPTCRPCLVYLRNTPDVAFQGVVVDMTPYGMCIRMMDQLASGTRVRVQMMRDEDFQEPMALPLDGLIRRIVPSEDGFTDHGVQLEVADIIPAERSKPVPLEKKKIVIPVKPKSSRMHTRDILGRDRGR